MAEQDRHPWGMGFLLRNLLTLVPEGEGGLLAGGS